MRPISRCWARMRLPGKLASASSRPSRMYFRSALYICRCIGSPATRSSSRSNGSPVRLAKSGSPLGIGSRRYSGAARRSKATGFRAPGAKQKAGLEIEIMVVPMDATTANRRKSRNRRGFHAATLPGPCFQTTSSRRLTRPFFATPLRSGSAARDERRFQVGG